MARVYDTHGIKNPNFRHGLPKGHGLLNTWQNMKARCLNPNHPKYHRYGGRGIKVCEDWIDSNGFIDWAYSTGWEEGMTIDRIDNDGDYCPENCQWLSHSANSRKKRTTKITFNEAQQIRKRIENGESEYVLAKEFNVVHGTIWFIANNFTHVPEGQCIKKIKARIAE